MGTEFTFSILHASARPDKWLEVYGAWIGEADQSHLVQYVLTVDSRWNFEYRGELEAWAEHTRNEEANVVVWNAHPYRYSGYVSGVNLGAQASSGHILIVNADDQYPCEHWDTKLLDVLASTRFVKWREIASEFVIAVSTGTNKEHERGILVMPILSRKRYERLGYVFYPEYESMFADNEFYEHASQDRVVIAAPQLLFPHRHWINQQRQPDEADKAQNRRELYESGHKILLQRRERKFNPPTIIDTMARAEEITEAALAKELARLERERPDRFATPATPEQPAQRTIALCLTGENFRGEWLDGFLNLYDHLIRLNFGIYRLREYNSNVYVTREQARQIILCADPKPELILWLDDDNICKPEQFDRLLQDLDENPETDGITAWAWIYDDELKRFIVSCGMWAPDHLKWQPFDGVEFPQETELRRVETSGFPCFLMRYRALEQAGPRPFHPILSEELTHGILGEDFAFMLHAEEQGLKFLVDPRVRVAHLKYRDVIPSFIQETDLPAQKVAVMMRVKNEGRWIRRVVESVKGLGSVYVLDDGSTDDTRAQVIAAGGCVLESPFRGEPLDEARDKNWLQSKVIDLEHPDWILCIDGDEELEPNGCEKLSRFLKTAKADTYSIRVLYLWDRPDQIRLDGGYAGYARLSLYRPNDRFQFRSYYESCGTHSGLHTGNAPIGEGPNQPSMLPSSICLLHYGYMLKEDRLKKYEYYNRIDPNNQIEDGYRHMVLGDLPELPWNAKLKHAGPLLLRRLPESFIKRPLLELPGAGVEVLGAPRSVETITPGVASDPPLPSNPAAATEDSFSLQRGGYPDPRKPWPLRLNLGCCDRKIPGFLGVDLAPGHAVDVVADLSKPWPWSDASVSDILAHDVIEHLPAKIETMNEIYRVLAPGGKVEIVVPTTEGPGAFQDPTHVSFWNRNSFKYFEAGNIYRERFAKSYGIKARFDVLSEDLQETMDGPKLRIVLRKAA